MFGRWVFNTFIDHSVKNASTKLHFRAFVLVQPLGDKLRGMLRGRLFCGPQWGPSRPSVWLLLHGLKWKIKHQNLGQSRRRLFEWEVCWLFQTVNKQEAVTSETVYYSITLKLLKNYGTQYQRHLDVGPFSCCVFCSYLRVLPVLRRSRDDLLSPPTPKRTHLRLIQGQSAPPPTGFKRPVHSSAPRQFLNLHVGTLAPLDQHLCF